MSAAGEMDEASRQRVLDARTRALAARGAAPTADTGAEAGASLLFQAAGRWFALPPGSVATIQRHEDRRLHPALLQAGARGIVRGVLDEGGRLVSVLDLAALLGEVQAAEAVPEQRGKLLLLRGMEPALALAVDHVVGLVALSPGDRRHGLDPDGRTVRLLDPAEVLRAVVALDPATS